MPKVEFAIMGGNPEFERPLPVGQLYFPSWERYTSAMRGIFERRYYTNHGPLTQKLEEELQTYLGVKHAVCVTNATIGLMMAADALGLEGKVILPSFTFIASVQSLSWAGVEPVFCDVNPATHQISVESVDAVMQEGVTAIMAVNLWGGACDMKALQNYAVQKGIKLYCDSAHAFGCEVDNQKIGGFAELEIFSFHATKILSAAEGGCITTNNDELAMRLRNIRSSYGAGKPASVVRTSNGRMSEAQAAIALLNLEDFGRNRQHNELIFQTYQKELQGIAGVKLITPTGVTLSNYQYIVCEIDEAAFGLSRDALLAVLKAENIIARRYFYPGAHRTVEYAADAPPAALPVTERLCDICLQLPVGAMVDTAAARRIAALLRRIHASAPLLKQAVEAREAV